MKRSEMTIRELEDREGVVYAIGVDMDSMQPEEIASVGRALEENFDEAAVMVFGIPLEDRAVIAEFDADDVQEIRDYGDLLEQLEVDDG